MPEKAREVTALQGQELAKEIKAHAFFEVPNLTLILIALISTHLQLPTLTLTLTKNVIATYTINLVMS